MTTHLLHVTIDEDDDDQRRGSVICPGVTAACRTWWECDRCRWEINHATDKRTGDEIRDGVYEDGERHGVEHQMIDGVPMIPGTQCIGQTLDGAWDSAHDAAQGREPGDYPASLDYEGDGAVYVSVIESEVTA